MNLVQVALRAEDLDRATDFWTHLLGAGPTGRFDPPGLVFFDLDGVRLLLERGAPASLLYVHLPGLRARLPELAADGVVVESEPHVIFHHDDAALGPAGKDEWQAFVRDSEGNLVGLVDFA
ncbi:VOC family protein [Xylanimonas protaetiae]|uniref:VOC family protein n=1 Tax=Xylanimonas protaetiae TaxID=2509457 RepID=A0A4P6FA72_9MICO|nr:VOC family protein [Xylanimonas protaetiae]QAY71843.1 VOC family protein [Xylanimonas protaetiae]